MKAANEVFPIGCFFMMAVTAVMEVTAKYGKVRQSTARMGNDGTCPRLPDVRLRPPSLQNTLPVVFCLTLRFKSLLSSHTKKQQRTHTSAAFLWRRRDLNPPLSDCEPDALPDELRPREGFSAFKFCLENLEHCCPVADFLGFEIDGNFTFCAFGAVRTVD